MRPQPTTPKIWSRTRRQFVAVRHSQLPARISSVTSTQLPNQRQRQHDGMVGDLLGAVIRNIRYRDPEFGRGGHVDVVEAHAVADDDARFGEP